MAKTYVWIVDTQNDFMLKGGKVYVPGAEVIIPNLKRLVQASAKLGVRILGSADEHPPDSLEFKDWPPHCLVGTEGQRNVPGTSLASKRVGVISWKKKYSPEQFKELASRPQVILTKDANDLLDPRIPSQIQHYAQLMETLPHGSTFLLAGVATDVCVLSEASALVKRTQEHGGEVYLVTDAVKELDKKGMRDAYERLTKEGVRFVETKEALKVISFASMQDTDPNNPKRF